MPVTRYWAKLRKGVSDFRISVQSLIKENCRNSRTSDDIDIKLGPVIKLDKRNKKQKQQQQQQQKAMTPCRQIVTSLSFSRFMTNLEQSKSRIQYA